MRGTEASHPRRYRLDEYSMAIFAAALQTAQGGDCPPQGRRPRADALQRTARRAAPALGRQGRRVQGRGIEGGSGPTGRSRRGGGAEVWGLGAAAAGAE